MNIGLSHKLTYPLDTVRRTMMVKSGRDDDEIKRHKNNPLELCGFLNKEFFIA